MQGLGPAAATPEILSALSKSLCDANGLRRSAALQAAANMGRAAATPDIIAAVLRLLREGDGQVHLQASRFFRTVAEQGVRVFSRKRRLIYFGETVAVRSIEELADVR